LTLSEWKERLCASPCAVIGLGVSNLPLIDFLLSLGSSVVARDCKTEQELGATARQLKEKGVRLCLGEHYLDGLSERTVFRSPGLRPDHPALLDALRNGAVLTSEMELFLELTPATVIGITGSDGKTTTTTVTGKIMEEECRRKGKGKVYTGGNIGTPLLPKVLEMTEQDFAVVELSSFQLQTMTRSPHRAAITNLTPNHLNWHTDMEEYRRAKLNICAHEPCGYTVLNAENQVTLQIGKELNCPIAWFSSKKDCPQAFSLKRGDCAVYVRQGIVYFFDGVQETELLKASDIRLPGQHNLENYMTAIALTHGLACADTVKEIATTFCGVPHRLELVRTFRGVKYYNSSIDSSPTRTAAALSALREKPIVICGGYDKNLSYAPLAQSLNQRAKAVVLTGATAEKIKAELDALDSVRKGILPVYCAPAFKDAVNLAKELATEGDTVLLSPACASFDAFKNFEERGNTFRKIVESFS
jgi:UDP-N-acetylmuramoylalanine--D-glutamate ligase